MRLAGMRSQLVEIWIQDAISDGEIRIVAQPGLEAADLQKIALALEMESNKTSIAFGQGVEGGRICVVSHTDDAIKLGRFINKQLGGKGGGEPVFIRAQQRKMPMKIYLKSFTENTKISKNQGREIKIGFHGLFAQKPHRRWGLNISIRYTF